jgi:hypothetical protein
MVRAGSSPSLKFVDANETNRVNASHDGVTAWLLITAFFSRSSSSTTYIISVWRNLRDNEMLVLYSTVEGLLVVKTAEKEVVGHVMMPLIKLSHRRLELLLT